MKDSLDKAIALHKKHMNGTITANFKSQMEMMMQMKEHKSEMAKNGQTPKSKDKPKPMPMKKHY